jgi:iron uptake system EfeUOB component EfeO/EfeM
VNIPARARAAARRRGDEWAANCSFGAVPGSAGGGRRPILIAVMRTSAQIALAAVFAVAVAGCGSGGAADDVLSMNSASCGGAWSLAAPGWHTFTLHNANTVGGEVDLIDPATNGVYAEYASFGVGTTVTMSLDVGSGKYAFRCLFDDQDPMTGPTEAVPGHAAGQAAIVPVTFNDLIAPDKQYHDYVQTGLATLARETVALDDDVRGGDLAAAREDWLTAHLQYETLGAAYDAFGDFDDEIDERADALGVTNPKWTGFYRIEYGLWHGQSAAELLPYTGKLASAVAALLKSWPQTEIPLLDIGLRTHEVLENALQFQLSGHDDYGSHTVIDTTLVNITGTRELLSVLQPLLASRYSGLPAVSTDLSRLQSLLEPVRGEAIGALPTATRQALDAACGQALQDLAPIASITEPRNI